MQPDILAYYPDPVSYLKNWHYDWHYGVTLLSPATSRVLNLYNKVLKLFPALPLHAWLKGRHKFLLILLMLLPTTFA